MIVTVKLINMSISSQFLLCICVVGRLKMYCLGKFQACSMFLLAIATMLYISSPELIHLITARLQMLVTNISSFP